MSQIYIAVAPYKPPTSLGYITIPILEFLKNQPYDDFARNFIAIYNPMFVRHTTDDCVTTDAWRNRITVYLTSDGSTIKRITLEASVGLTGGYTGGHDIYKELLKRGINI